MDLDRYLGLPPPSTNVVPEPRQGKAREGLGARLTRRLALVGSLSFAVAWIAVVKLRLLDGVMTTIAFVAALLVLGAVVTVAWLRREEPESSLVRDAEAKLKDSTLHVYGRLRAHA